VGTNTAATVDRNFCAGQEITIGSDVYNEANPSGETIIPNTMGCDSVVTVELTFASQVSGTANAEFCEGGSIEVLQLSKTRCVWKTKLFVLVTPL